jgi:hypothetical protein
MVKKAQKTLESKSKYGVSKDTSKRTCDGIVFDSEMEMKFYRDVVLPEVGSGEIVHYELQKPYTLQPKFKRAGKNVQAITYVADFYIEYRDGSVIVYDVKGMADATAKIKRKMFWYVYPDIDYRWITLIKKYGGWVDYDEVQQRRKDEKKSKKLMEENNCE